MARRIISSVLCAAMLMLGASCNYVPPQDVMTDGASKFSLGKTTEDYAPKDSGELLKELIDKYSGSYYNPTNKPMSDDEYEEAKKKHPSQEESSSPAEPSRQESSKDSSQQESSEEESTDISGSQKPTVSNMTDLTRVFREAYHKTAESVEFVLGDGFVFNAGTDLEKIYRTLQREDPTAVAGVAQWTTWFQNSDYYVGIQYFFDIKELKQMKQETPALVNEAVSKIKPRSNSDYDIVYAVNDYLCDTVYYPDEPYAPVTHTAYGALKNGCAVCEGYACAAKLILNQMGVECDIQVGEVPNAGGHAWNLVKVDNSWYQLDITWNDPSPNRLEYFLVTDEFMKQSRTWDESEYPKSARKAYGA